MIYKKLFRFLIITLTIAFLTACGAVTTIAPTTSVPTTGAPTTETPTTQAPTTQTPTTQPPTTEAPIFLPELEGEDKAEIILILSDLDLNFRFVYEKNTSVDEDFFIKYGNELQPGIQVTKETDVPVVIATPYFVLPDLSGKTQSEIFMMFLGQGFTFSFEVVVDNDIPDQTFSGYGEGLGVGDPVTPPNSVVIYIGFNTVKLPDLTGMLKGEIQRVLTDLQIAHSFEYVVDDEYPEDMFVEYVDFDIDDFYEDEPIVVRLYKNTFTDNETSLIISKYIDGGYDTNDQAIEIYNPTDSQIFLGDYHLVIYANGSFTVTYRIDFPEQYLSPGDTFLIANRASTNGDLLRKANANGVISLDLLFDGNDTIQLRYKNDTYIDTIYNIGNNAFIMDNEIFVRKPSIVVGTRNFNTTQWTAYVPSYIDIVGSHPVAYEPTVGPTFQLIPRSFYDPLGGMNLVTVGTINDGDTAHFIPGFTDGARVRFLGVDTPETHPIVEPWGLEGKAYTTLILQSAIQIYIQSDPAMSYTDTYGRHLGLIWVNLGEDGLVIDILNSSGDVMRTEYLSGWILLNYHLVLNGFSFNYYGSSSNLVFNNRYIYRWFQEAQVFAQRNGLGVHE